MFLSFSFNKLYVFGEIMANIRTSIPSNLVSDVMFSSGRTCSVCRERGKTLLVHHIDENPANNTFGNLTALCLDCHCDAQTKGGSDPKLPAKFVMKLRDEWLSKLEIRRNISNQMAVSREVIKASLSLQVEQSQAMVSQQVQTTEPLIDYITSLPAFKAALLAQGKPQWASTVKQTVIQGNYDYIDSLKGILVLLATSYSPNQFDVQTPQEYFLEVISSRFKWHRITAEPNGPGTGDAMVNINCGKAVIAEVEMMIEQMVIGLVTADDTFDKDDWLAKWRG